MKEVQGMTRKEQDKIISTKRKNRFSTREKIYGVLFNSGFLSFILWFPENWWWIGGIWCLTIIVIYMVYLRNER
jgi:hypothetical protein